MCCSNLGIDLLENQVKEAKQMVEESDIKYDEVARKLAMVSSSRGLYHKAYYGRNLQISVISQTVCP